MSGVQSRPDGQPRARDVLRAMAEHAVVCVRPIAISRVNLDAGHADIPCGARVASKCRPLRYFFATTLITNHAEPQEVQRLLRHKTLQIMLETYVHWWPKRERRRGVVGTVLPAAAGRG